MARPSDYGEAWAEDYDEQFAELGAPDRCVEFLRGLAGGGPVLELAVGTGRVALPLRAKGVEVHGVDISEAMVRKLRAKPGGAGLPVTIGDMASVRLGRRYPLVYLVFNTIFILTTAAEQEACFRTAAEHLQPGGAFVIEAFVPDLRRFDAQGQRVEALDLEKGLTLDVARHDLAGQRISARRLILSESETRILPIELRYAWPSELDLMARLAGLRLRERWEGWAREPFTSASLRHVSVYETS